MKLRKEQIVFAVALALVALLAWRGSGKPPAPRIGSGARAELARHGAPPLELVQAQPLAAEGERDLFAPPSVARPLPPLEFAPPPLLPLAAIFPPPEPGPAPASYGALLRRAPSLAPVAPVPGLFDATAAELDALEQARELEQSYASELESAAPERGVVPAAGAARPSAPLESAQERAARVESYKRQYDWIQLSPYEHNFGRIANAERFALGSAARMAEPILFTEVNPLTGLERFPGQGAISYERARVLAFAFADTVANGLELRRAQLAGPVTRSSWNARLALAADCVAAHLDAPRALGIARELYAELIAFDPQDPEPRLGLARCQEADFDYEGALATYLELQQRFDHRAAVHLGLAGLYERLLLDERAEEHHRLAIAREPAGWRPQAAFGAWLLRQGRWAEARERLEQANRYAPETPEERDARVRIRCDLARAQLAEGRWLEAANTSAQALRADPSSSPARAAVAATALIGRLQQSASGASTELAALRALPELAAWLDGAAAQSEELGAADFELLLCSGLHALASKDWSAARERLELAAAADPLRAQLAWRALSALAEQTGHPEEAQRFVELAVECAPLDAWSHYQRGRIQMQRDDPEGARASFEAALAGGLGFEAALVELGQAHARAGEHESARRCFDQALLAAPGRAETLTLRGLALAAAGDFASASESFEAALVAAPADPVAAAGLAWSVYRGGDAQEALVQLAALDDRRRSEPEDDPWRSWSREQSARLRDHLDKAQWRERFERSVLKNGWETDEGAGPLVSLVDGRLRIEGVFASKGAVRAFQSFKSASLFVSIEADLRVSSGSKARAGIYVARERDRRGASEVQHEARISRHAEGPVQVRFVRSGELDAPESDVLGVEFPTDRWVRLRIELEGGADARVTVWIDGVPVRERIAMPGLGHASSELRAGVFVEGEPGRRALVELDEVEIVYRTGGS
jgi:Tfp pilus assembly protein PilF